MVSLKVYFIPCGGSACRNGEGVFDAALLLESDELVKLPDMC